MFKGWINLRNLDIQRGLCNGTRLTVKEMHENLIIAETIATDRQTHELN